MMLIIKNTPSSSRCPIPHEFNKTIIIKIDPNVNITDITREKVFILFSNKLVLHFISTIIRGSIITQPNPILLI